MALARKEVLVVDAKGNVQPGASVTVRREVAGQPLEPLYSDRDGLESIINPVTADSAGVAAFHCLGGAFQIVATLGAFSRTQRYVPIGTAGETDAGVVLTTGAAGWLFDDATADADPGSGLFRLNNADPASATELYIDNENAGAADVSAWLDSLDDGGGSAMRGHLHICDPDQPTQVFHIYAVSGSVVGEGSPDAGYRKLTVAHVAGAGALTTGTLYAFGFTAKGEASEAGDVTGPASATDGQLAVFDGATGKAITGAATGSPPEPVTLADLEPANAAILKADTSDDLEAGFTATSADQGTKTTGTFTPTFATRNIQHCVNGGAFTLGVPTGHGSLVLDITNDGSAGAITTSGFTLVTGDSFTTTDTHAFRCFITTGNAGSHLHVQAFQ